MHELVVVLRASLLLKVPSANDYEADETKKWVGIHKRCKADLKDMPELSWSKEKKLTGLAKVPRVVEAVDIAYLRYHAAEVAAGRANRSDSKLLACPWFLDTTQCISRKAHCDHIRGMCSSSVFYSFALDRILTPKEHLLALGWGEGALNLTPVTQAQVRELAGESMSVPCIALLLHCVALQLDLWDTEI